MLSLKSSMLMEHAMFLAVLTVALFILSAATGDSGADSCTASLPPLVGGGGECSASGGMIVMTFSY